MFEIFSDKIYTKKIAELNSPGFPGIVVEANEFTLGNISVLSVVPTETRVQYVTDFTIRFQTEHQLYNPAQIKIQFSNDFTLPRMGSTMQIDALGESREYFTARSGKVLPLNFIQIEDVFAGNDPPTTYMVYEIVVIGVQNPISTKPAG